MPPGHAVGHEGVAEVVAVGDDVRAVKVGDRVVVPFQINCGECTDCLRGATGSCAALPLMAMYGMAPLAGLDGGGFLADLVLVPYADAMLVALPPADRRVLVLGQLSIGLYATATASALGAHVDYIDTDPNRLAAAEKLGAVAHDPDKPDKSADPYPVTVHTTADPALLAATLRATWPDEVIDSLAGQSLTPVVDRVVPWGDAPAQWPVMTGKTVFSRDA